MSETDGVRPRSPHGPSERMAAGEAEPSLSVSLPPPAVAGPEMARRLAEDTAALAGAESGLGDDPALLVGEEEREPALGFYLLLGAMVAAVLAIVIGYSSSHSPVDTGAVQGALRARLAPAGSPGRPPQLLAPLSPNPAGTLMTPASPTGRLSTATQPGAALMPASPYATGALGEQPSPGQSPLPRAPNLPAGPESSHRSAGPNGASPADAAPRRLPDLSLQLHVPPTLLPANPGSAAPAATPSRPGGRRLVFPDAAFMRQP